MTKKDQTLSFLLRRFEEAGIQPRHKLGQNFLMDMNLQKLLVRRADIQETDIILEVGTGTGGVTVQMAPLARKVITVELDPQLFILAGEELQDFENVVALQTDILKNKNNLNPIVLDEINRARAENPESDLKLVANLPYNVATPIMSNLLGLECPPKSMTVTIQKEVGDRMMAQPGTKDYGALSIWFQSQAEVEIVRIMPPGVFFPPPKVYSAIIHVDFMPEKRENIRDLRLFHEFIRAMFFHRRKFLRSELLSAFKGRLQKTEVDAVLEKLNLSGECRAEELDVPTMIQLCDEMNRMAQQRSSLS
ncbi:MAG: 16S rRNA (adenine(1518)-N(6)/adenine(1519)-N(6))-dimethyltransferase RsmA [Planctomycetia bacterium]|nr:16S rRNA (adenine(1518)-N(6)/adenine(1519)-N(6))-dimethyltransferase RsmA [Planctomycetia bacterium]